MQRETPYTGPSGVDSQDQRAVCVARKEVQTAVSIVLPYQFLWLLQGDADDLQVPSQQGLAAAPSQVRHRMGSRIVICISLIPFVHSFMHSY